MASQLYARIPTYNISHLITVSSVPASVDLVCSLLRREMKGDSFLEPLHLLPREPWTGGGYLIERFLGLSSTLLAETFLKGDGFIFLENLCNFICSELLVTQGREAWKVFCVLLLTRFRDCSFVEVLRITPVQRWKACGEYFGFGSGVEWIDNINHFSVVWVCSCLCLVW